MTVKEGGQMQAARNMGQIAELIRQTDTQADADAREQEIVHANLLQLEEEMKQADYSAPRETLALWLEVTRQTLDNWMREGKPVSMAGFLRLRRVWDLDFTQPIEKGTFFRMLTGQDMGLYLSRPKLMVVRNPLP